MISKVSILFGVGLIVDFCSFRLRLLLVLLVYYKGLLGRIDTHHHPPICLVEVE